MADSTPKSYHTDPTLWLYTSLTSGSSHIISATSRMQTILKANKIEFQALDVATDEKARMLWGRRAGKRKLPGLVRFGMIVGDLEEVEEWNEYGELKDNVNLPGPAKAAPATPTPSTANTPSKAPQAPPPPTTSTTDTKTGDAPDAAATAAKIPSEPASASKASPAATDESKSPVSAESTLTMAMRQAGFEAAKKAGDAKTKARQDEIERLKAKSADLEKLDNSGPTGMPPPSGTTEAQEAVKPESGTTASGGAADAVPLTKEGEREKAVEGEAEAKGADTVSEETNQAAEKDMAMSADNATSIAAEPEVLEGQGEIEPEKTSAAAESEPQPMSSTRESEVSAPKAEPEHIPNPKELEEAANKAIIADESTHVHIAGSPPPHASPGMKYPRDEEEEAPSSSAPKNKIEAKEETDGTAAAEPAGKLTKEENEAGKVDNVETKTVSEETSTTESAAPVEEPAKVEEETKANTEQNKPSIDDPTHTDEEVKAGSKATAEPLTEDSTKVAEEVGEEATPKTEPAEESTDHAKKTEVEPAATHEKQDLPGTKTQEQPAASGDQASESVAD